MGGLKKSRIVTVFAIFLLCLSLNYARPAAIELDEGLIDLAFEKLKTLDPTVKSDAIDLLEIFFNSEQGLEDLKDSLPDILALVVGENYQDLLSKHGLSLGRLKSDIDDLKKWSKEDRLKLLDLIEKGDKEGVKALVEKYEGSDNSASGGGSLPEQPIQNQPVFPEISIKFNDIENHWARTYIEFIASKGIIKGKADGLFAPEDRVTRAEFTAMLVRLLKLEDEGTGKDLPFTDVKPDDWFYSIVKAAYNSGLARGIGNKFDPNSLITRQEMAVLVTRAASIMNKSAFVDSAEVEKILSAYKDRDRISDWAKTEIAVAVKLGLISGVSADILVPGDTATRAQAATVIYNLYRLIYE
ncbi:S-layer homology domain-containing protein [Thermosediminibacter oceani]|uniref:S-layer domain protein n=1 Tax=Thermosediminibacter oceani (strain ATCC BAA-1034 / DSM 16646 / JW/IW-1228P) TaxID=555079 RepID=D9S1J5_THEOJ|nr:S-layer homology domain-containing protein [Thermosediminibacter oceani]ADL07272.1 S-layer domain protein [Thermosediminibacter oceani DSM 16646]